MNNPNASGEDALHRDDHLVAPYEAQLQSAVNRVAGGEAPDRVLSGITEMMPANAKAAVTRRFQFLLHQRGVKPTQPTLDVAVQPPRPQDPARRKFGLAQAALLMATGTLDAIKNLVLRRPDVAARIQDIGQKLARNGVQADMVLLERLEIVRAQAIERIRQQRNRAGGGGPGGGNR